MDARHARAALSVQTELVIIQAFQEIARDEFGRLARHFDLSVSRREPLRLDRMTN
jgi:hypothetical protein